MSKSPGGHPLWMTYLRHLRITWSGLLGPDPSVEQWSCGLQVGKFGTVDGQPFPNATDTQLGLVRDAIAAFHQNPPSEISPFARLTTVKCALIGADGRYIGESRRLDFPGMAGGGSSGNRHPYSVARVVSLNTGFRGPANRGRFYTPLPAAVVADDGHTSPASAQGVAQTAATMLTAINAAFGNTLTVVVASSKAVNQKVTSVRVGTVLDTVRSRRTSLPELYGADVAVA